MARKRKQLERLTAGTQIAPPARSKRYRWLFFGAVGCVLTGILVFGVAYEVMSKAGIEYGSLESSLGDLTTMPEEQLANQDIALMNLRCAEGLSGSEELDIAACLATLDKWAAWVQHETDRHLYKYRQNPAEFENSEAYFRMLMLITVLQQDFKVHYNPDRIRDVDFRRSEDLFIHGMLGDGDGGTCVSMPVLYTAVARRLGYPVYLVTAREHVFCRWDSRKDRSEGPGWKCRKLRRVNYDYGGILWLWQGHNTVEYGPAEGKNCEDATSADIAACLAAKPKPPGNPGLVSNCQTDVWSAADACCLSAPPPLTIIPVISPGRPLF